MERSIEVHDLTFGYNHGTILENIDFHVDKNYFYSIIGPNGTGKSTLLKLICNVLIGRQGYIALNDKNLTTFSPKGLAKRIAFVPQNTFVDFEFTVKEVISMGRIPYLRRFQGESIRDRDCVEEAMHLTDTFHLKNKKINEISGGERQRVIIAKAIAQKTDILLLDEPVSHLDIHHQIGLLNVIKKLQKEKRVTIVSVLHDLNLAASYSDRLILLHDRKIFQIGTPEEVITKENIKEVYKMDVYMMKNPINQKPYMVPIM